MSSSSLGCDFVTPNITKLCKVSHQLAISQLECTDDELALLYRQELFDKQKEAARLSAATKRKALMGNTFTKHGNWGNSGKRNQV